MRVIFWQCALKETVEKLQNYWHAEDTTVLHSQLSDMQTAGLSPLLRTHDVSQS